MKKENKKKVLVKLTPRAFEMFFKDAPELKHAEEAANITGEVVREMPDTKLELVIEFPGLGTRNLSRDDVKFVWQFLVCF